MLDQDKRWGDYEKSLKGKIMRKAIKDIENLKQISQ